MQAYRGENVAHARAHGGNLSHMTATRRHRVGRCRNASVTRAPFAVGSDDGRRADTAPRAATISALITAGNARRRSTTGAS